MLSLHDHFVREFSVDADANRLRFRTAFPTATGPSAAEANFEGVEGYVIVGDALGTIILAIDEVDPVALYDEFGALMRETYQRSGGHGPWVRTRDDAERFLRGKELKGYSLS